MQNLVLFFSLILTRVGAFVVVLPLFGGTNVPRLVGNQLLIDGTVYFDRDKEVSGQAAKSAEKLKLIEKLKQSQPQVGGRGGRGGRGQ